MKLRHRRIVIVIVGLIMLAIVAISQSPSSNEQSVERNTSQATKANTAMAALESLAIKGRSPKTDYSRSQFGDGWQTISGCDTRNIILNRDLTMVETNDECQVESGVLDDPYTGKRLEFRRGSDTSAEVQIDHVVALADAWQKGAQLLSKEERVKFANDPLELLAVDGSANQQKSGSDAASWLPSNKGFRCEYVARQIAVKIKYDLWVTQAEHDAIIRVLQTCSDQQLP